MHIKLFWVLFFIYNFFLCIKADDNSTKTTIESNTAKTHEIIWVRPFSKGQIYFAATNLKIKTIFSASSQNSSVNKKTILRDIYYGAKITVLDIDDRKIPTQEKHEVLYCYEINNNTKTNMISKGNTLMIRKTEMGKEILLNDKPVEKELSATLNQTIELNTGGPTYNEMLGVVKHAALGGEWPIAEKNIIEAYKSNKIEIEPNAISGKSIFEKIDNNLLYFSGSFTINPLPIPLAKDKKLLSSKYNWKLDEIAPLDINLLPIKLTKTTRHIYTELEDPKNNIEITADLEKEYTIKYFKSEEELLK